MSASTETETVEGTATPADAPEVTEKPAKPARPPSSAPVTPRLKTRYREEILPALKCEFEIANVMQVPGLTKIVVNMGVGRAARASKLIEGAIKRPHLITGQKPLVTKAASRSRSSSCARARRSVRTPRSPTTDVEFLDRAAVAGAAASVTSEASRRGSSTARQSTPSG